MASESEYQLIKKQRDLLFDGLKKLAKSGSTPDMIKTYLNKLAKQVLAVRPQREDKNASFNVGDLVTTKTNKVCRYKIESMYEECGVKLCTLKTVWVKDNLAPTEGTHNNIPIDLLNHYN